MIKVGKYIMRYNEKTGEYTPYRDIFHSSDEDDAFIFDENGSYELQLRMQGLIIDSEEEDDEEEEEECGGIARCQCGKCLCDSDHYSESESESIEYVPVNNNNNVPKNQNQTSKNAVVSEEKEKFEVKVPLPGHACSYCAIHDPLNVAQCLKCSKWFCNSNKSDSRTSHIINHLMKSGHNEIALHPKSPLSDGAKIECFNCGCTNLFLLGHVYSKDNLATVFLCRQPCVRGKVDGRRWNLNTWSPLIHNLRLVPWLCRFPSEEQLALVTNFDSGKYQELEKMWKSGHLETSIEDVTRIEKEAALRPAQIVYKSPVHFKETMMPLLIAEARVELELKMAQKLNNATIRWDRSINNATVFWFKRPLSDVSFKIMPGDEVTIRHPSPSNKRSNWSAVGNIISVPHDPTAKIPVEIRTGGYIPSHINSGFSIEFEWNSASFDRQCTALNSFISVKNCMSKPIKEFLLGNGHLYDEFLLGSAKLPKKLSAPNLPILNDSQEAAVRYALRKPMTLIQGPPGTGKTVTSASIVYHLAPNGPVLVVASSNVAVDHLTEKILQTGLRVVRVTSKLHELKESPLAHLSLHRQALATSNNPVLRKLQRLKSEVGQLCAEDQNMYTKLLREAEGYVLRDAQVVCCTCIGAGDPRVSKKRFNSVLIDEATQATETEALVALVRGAQQVVMVGDHKQLGPIVLSKACKKAEFDRSLFERLMLMGTRPIRLQVQYRMHPSLSEFPSNMFYQASLRDGVSVTDRKCSNLDSFWPKPNIPMFLLNCSATEELAPSGVSYLNRAEANGVEKIVTKLLSASIKPSQIGVITPYQGQRSYIIQNMISKGPLQKELYEDIEVASVDAFQGREKDYIILSLVRSNDNSTIGFVADPRRMNVALTRARYGLIILGNSDVLSTSHLWKNLVNQFKKYQILMDGFIGNMRPASVVDKMNTLPLPSPKH